MTLTEILLVINFITSFCILLVVLPVNRILTQIELERQLLEKKN